MAHSRIFSDVKLERLSKAVGEPIPHVIGHLECLWQYAYQHCIPKGRIDKDDIETASRWDGQPGVFVAALIRECFVDVRSLMNRRTRRVHRCYFIHKFLHNAPSYVRKRISTMKLRDGKGAEKVRKIPSVSVEPNRTKENPIEPPPPTPSVEGRAAEEGGGIAPLSTEAAKKRLEATGMNDDATITDILSKRKAKDVIGWCDWFDEQRKNGADIGAGLLAKKLLSGEPPPPLQVNTSRGAPPERQRWPWTCDACHSTFMLAFREPAIGANLKCDSCGNGTLKLDAAKGAKS